MTMTTKPRVKLVNIITMKFVTKAMNNENTMTITFVAKAINETFGIRTKINSDRTIFMVEAIFLFKIDIFLINTFANIVQVMDFMAPNITLFIKDTTFPAKIVSENDKLNKVMEIFQH
ncbi:uncharacterized protein LOC113467552 [Diaphorina citri]|uniref:Uncharacterized protein LOC113467552 n=1 Tax=Diaphorina citri TaxID=121845 RepID=A0A3Q0IYT8_DIACI|nr:uncharacterized protein LOC113467552 [Diaphorina citri]